jgi:hypothetical protein
MTIDVMPKAATSSDARYVDFEISAKSLGSEAKAAYFPLDLVFVWATGDEIQTADRRGRVHVRPEIVRRVLAKGGFSRESGR